jgi:hypothetical protein
MTDKPKEVKFGFIEAIIEIAKRDDLKFCDDTKELEGEHPSICVYQNGNFAGKLRWPDVGRNAYADESLQDVLFNMRFIRSRDKDTKKESGAFYEKHRQGQKDEKFKGSVKVMRSYDYCHFEICLGSDEEKSLQEIDEMRKEAARLTDQAVKQYQEMKKHTNYLIENDDYLERLRVKVTHIEKIFPKSTWTPEEKAEVIALRDVEFQMSQRYDYQDEWEL